MVKIDIKKLEQPWTETLKDGLERVRNQVDDIGPKSLEYVVNNPDASALPAAVQLLFIGGLKLDEPPPNASVASRGRMSWEEVVMENISYYLGGSDDFIEANIEKFRKSTADNQVPKDIGSRKKEIRMEGVYYHHLNCFREALAAKVFRDEVAERKRLGTWIQRKIGPLGADSFKEHEATLNRRRMEEKLRSEYERAEKKKERDRKKAEQLLFETLDQDEDETSPGNKVSSSTRQKSNRKPNDEPPRRSSRQARERWEFVSDSDQEQAEMILSNPKYRKYVAVLGLVTADDWHNFLEAKPGVATGSDIKIKWVQSAKNKQPAATLPNIPTRAETQKTTKKSLKRKAEDSNLEDIHSSPASPKHKQSRVVKLFIHPEKSKKLQVKLMQKHYNNVVADMKQRAARDRAKLAAHPRAHFPHLIDYVGPREEDDGNETDDAPLE